MTLARWPNEGFVHIGELVGGAPHGIHGIPGDKIGRFVYEGDRPKHGPRRRTSGCTATGSGTGPIRDKRWSRSTPLSTSSL